MTSAGQRLLCPTLVGREEELATLADALAGVARNGGRTVLLGGDAGIGKSALLRRYGELARGRGARVVVGECIEIEARRPLGPFVEIVESARRSGLVRAQDMDALTPLAASDVDPTLRSRAYQGYARIFSTLSKASPVVLAIEDLHWADEATLELFPYLARRVGFDRIVLIGTYRTDELHRRHPLRPVLADLHRLRLSDQVTVTRLEPAAVGTFIRETLRLDQEPSKAFRDAVDERCEGNPFFIEEVLEALHRHGALEFSDGRWHRTSHSTDFVIPDSIRDAVAARLGYLPPEVRRVLLVAAVIGQRFEFELLRAITSLTNDQLIALVRAALESQILQQTEPNGTFAFRHALTREAVLGELLEPERRTLHLAIGTALEQGGRTSDRVEELAFHFDAGGDPERAFRYHLAAADVARGAAAYARAANHLERAIALAPDSEDVAVLYDRLGRTAALVSQGRAARANEEAWRRFTEAGDALKAGNALSRLSRSRLELGDPNCTTLAQEAVRILEPLGETRELAEAYEDLARSYVRNGQRDLGIRIAERAVALARATGWTEKELGARITLAMLSSQADVTAEIALLREAIDTGRHEGFVGLVSRAYNNLIAVQTSQLIGDPRVVLKEWRDFAEKSGYFPDTFFASVARLALADGDFDAVLRCVGQGESDTTWTTGIQGCEAVVRVARQGPDAGAEIILDAERRATRRAIKVYVAADAIQCLLLGGDSARVLDRANGLAEAIGGDRSFGPAGAEVVVAALIGARVVGERDARERWTGIAKILRDRGGTDRLGSLYADGEAAVQGGDLSVASRLLDEVARGFDQALAPVSSTFVRLRRVELLRSADRATALLELERVVAFWRKGKAVWYLGELERWTLARGLAFPRLAEEMSVEVAPTAKALTARELEVARFVSEGLTNKEIADRLIISERTAEGHVQRILDKLRFRSRAQVAAWFTEKRIGAIASRG